jgi:hypothetical protein
LFTFIVHWMGPAQLQVANRKGFLCRYNHVGMFGNMVASLKKVWKWWSGAMFRYSCPISLPATLENPPTFPVHAFCSGHCQWHKRNWRNCPHYDDTCSDQLLDGYVCTMNVREAPCPGWNSVWWQH